MKRILFVLSLALGVLSFAGSQAEYNRQIDDIEEGIKITDEEEKGFVSGVRYNEMRGVYDKGYKLLVAIANDSDLGKEAKLKLLKRASDIISGGLEKISQPYTDVNRVNRIRLGDGHWLGKDTVEGVGSTLWYLIISTGRDLTSAVTPQFWRDRRLTKFMKATADDFNTTYDESFEEAEKAEHAERGKYNHKLGALYNLLQEIGKRDVEPVRNGLIHKLTVRFYLFMGWVYWAVGPTFDFVGFLNWNERTKMTGFYSWMICGVIGTALWYVRRVNSGYAYYLRTRRTMRRDERARRSGALTVDANDDCLKKMLEGIDSAAYGAATSSI